jgi:hypothetical protein
LSAMPAASVRRNSHNSQSRTPTSPKTVSLSTCGTQRRIKRGRGDRSLSPEAPHPDTCPVRSLRKWISAAEMEIGSLFRRVSRYGKIGQEPLNKDFIGLIVKRAAERAGYDSSTLAGHSLRAGLATQAAMNGTTELTIMKQTGHRSLATLRRYIREGDLWRQRGCEPRIVTTSRMASDLTIRRPLWAPIFFICKETIQR